MLEAVAIGLVYCEMAGVDSNRLVNASLSNSFSEITRQILELYSTNMSDNNLILSKYVRGEQP